MAETEDSGVMSLTVTLLSAYFANNTVPSAELPALVEGTRRALLGDAPVTTPAAASVTEEVVPDTSVAAPEYKPMAAIEESLASPDHILSLIDGKPYKALKRHLSAHGLTPAEYRGRYGLPADYPMVARGYSAARREVALKLGLGGKRKRAATPVAQEVPAPPVAVAPEPAVADTPPAKPAPARRSYAKSAKAKPKLAAQKPKPKGSPVPVAEEVRALPVTEGPEPAVADTPPAKPTPARRPRTKAADAEPKPAAKKPKHKVLKIAAAKAPAASAGATTKPKATRAKKTDADAAPSAKPAPEAVLAAD